MPLVDMKTGEILDLSPLMRAPKPQPAIVHKKSRPPVARGDDAILLSALALLVATLALVF
jgi:hypothetical protein